MNLLEEIIKCPTDEDADNLVKDAIKQLNENSTKIEQLGFLDGGNQSNSVAVFKGFIPLNTRIKYESWAMETYGMETVDYFYEFAHLLRRYNICKKGVMVERLESFINCYFGYPGKTNRREIFNELAWKTTSTDEAYFMALANNKIGDLKGKGAAECTERSALAQQILSLFGIESYYCMGCVDLGDRQEGHCFNIVKRKNDYALLDYSLPVSTYDSRGSIKSFHPFIGIMSNEEFEDFIRTGVLKSFPNYYINNGKRTPIDGERTYIIGEFQISKKQDDAIKK